MRDLKDEGLQAVGDLPAQRRYLPEPKPNKLLATLRI
jgi:hypothetical protein